MASAFLAALPLLVAGRYHPASYGFLFGKSSGLNSPNATDNNIVDAQCRNISNEGAPNVGSHLLMMASTDDTFGAIFMSLTTTTQGVLLLRNG